MAYNAAVSGIGFESGMYGPPHNLGRAFDYSYELTAYSRIWGVDHYEGEVPIPKSFKVKAQVARMGYWVFLHVDECLHPMHALKRSPAQENPPKSTTAAVGESWYEYPWAYDDGIWKDGEMDAYPDRIYFEEMLPPEVLEYGVVGSQHSVPIVEYNYSLDYLFEDKWYVNPAVQHTMGTLTIRDNGEMEILGNYDWSITKMTKYEEGGQTHLRAEEVIPVTKGFQVHWPSEPYSRPGKNTTNEDYYVGFHDFTLVFKLGAETYKDALLCGFIKKDQLPTKATASKLITKCGLNLDKYHNPYTEEEINDTDSETVKAYKKKLRLNRQRAKVYKMWDEFKKVYWDKTNGTHTVRLARLLKELKQMYPDATKSLAEFATNSLPAEGVLFVWVPVVKESLKWRQKTKPH